MNDTADFDELPMAKGIALDAAFALSRLSKALCRAKLPGMSDRVEELCDAVGDIACDLANLVRAVESQKAGEP